MVVDGEGHVCGFRASRKGEEDARGSLLVAERPPISPGGYDRRRHALHERSKGVLPIWGAALRLLPRRPIESRDPASRTLGPSSLTGRESWESALRTFLH